MEALPYKIPHPFRRLSIELVDAIVKDISEGSPHKYAAEANGITERIFYIWVNQGKIDIDLENPTLPAYLVQSLAKIKQEEIKWCREQIKKYKKGHKGAEWTLEHAHWRIYSNNAPAKELAAEIEELKNTLRNGEANGETNSGEEKQGA
jgi:O-phosphoseryl-tRNA(Cys) synthetase